MLKIRKEARIVLKAFSDAVSESITFPLAMTSERFADPELQPDSVIAFCAVLAENGRFLLVSDVHAKVDPSFAHPRSSR